MNSKIENQEKKIVFLLNDEFNASDSVYCADQLRSAGFLTEMVGLSSKSVRSERGIQLRADGLIEELHSDQVSMVIITGGKQHVQSLMIDPRVRRLLRNGTDQNENFKIAWLASDIQPDQMGWLQLDDTSHFIQKRRAKIWEFTEQLIELAQEATC